MVKVTADKLAVWFVFFKSGDGDMVGLQERVGYGCYCGEEGIRSRFVRAWERLDENDIWSGMDLTLV